MRIITLAADTRAAKLLDCDTVSRVLLPLVAFGVDALLLALAVVGLVALRDHPRALALLGVWLVSNLALSLMRPVGSQKRAHIVRDAPFVMLALFFIPLFAPPLSAWGEAHGIWATPWAVLPPALTGTVMWGGVLVTAAGLTLRISAMRLLGSRFSPQIAMQPEHALETGGPYSRVRHPGYLGALLATAGAILAFGSMIAWPLFALMLLAQNARASREEALLKKHFGDEWLAYRKQAGRFIPRLGSRRRVS